MTKAGIQNDTKEPIMEKAVVGTWKLEIDVFVIQLELFLVSYQVTLCDGGTVGWLYQVFDMILRCINPSKDSYESIQERDKPVISKENVNKMNIGTEGFLYKLCPNAFPTDVQYVSI